MDRWFSHQLLELGRFTGNLRQNLPSKGVSETYCLCFQAPGEPNECGVESNAWEVGEARCSIEGEDAVEIDFRPRLGGSGGWNDMHVEGLAGHSGGLSTTYSASHKGNCFGCSGAYGAYPLCETVHPDDCTSTGGTALEGSP